MKRVNFLINIPRKLPQLINYFKYFLYCKFSEMSCINMEMMYHILKGKNLTYQLYEIVFITLKKKSIQGPLFCYSYQ